ncbi:ABC transporter permease [Halodesulfurarchaeum sp.]|uniref:ABC transporter permease n=1 Tax=Halodesulfurarchaeum sp. TaxID=1980530 RepID=UPI001BBD5E1F|nr:ABC transporter permease [Halodesulfurarchaeum sp.]
MNRLSRIWAETKASWHSFLRQRTAIFFTFGFPLLLVGIFGVIVQTDPTGAGLFARPVGYYVPGYLAVIVLFTPLSRIGSTVARYRDRRQFEKLATTPLSGAEWLGAHTIVNTGIILLASGLVLAVLMALTDAQITLSLFLVPFIVAGVVVFVGLGAILGRIADSRDGVIAASNSVALPLVFLSDTFVAPDQLPAWGSLLIELSPLTYFARGVRQVTYQQAPATSELLVLVGFAILFFVLGAVAVPQPD